jgi:GNAT superfamily N-acetyltransferase
MIEHNTLKLNYQPLIPERWQDFESLFGVRGACDGCWCMWWRILKKEFDAQKGEGNRQAMHQLVQSGKIPGILAYQGDQAIGWCSVAPRPEFPRLKGSKILAPVDDQPVWSIVCLFIAKEFRRKGVSVFLLKSAIDYVRQQGGRIVEGYAVEPKQGKTADAFAFPGLASAYHQAGFAEVARRSETRPIMRYVIG